MASNIHKKSATGSFEQWASKLINFSTQYNSSGWSASSALGEPKVYPRYGDITGAWAQGKCDSEQFIELGYETDVFVSAIHIYETLNSGGVRRVSVQSPQGSWDTVWETDKAQLISTSRIFSPEFTGPNYRTKAVRLDIDCTVSESWVEIDAVQMVGKKLKVDSPPPLSALANDFAKLVNDKKSSDTVFHFEGRDVYAHRAILSVRSRELKDILARESLGSVIPIEDIGYDAFLGVLHYIYSSSIPDKYSSALLVDVWRAGTKLQVDGLGAYCVAMIDDRINVDNVVDVFTTASEKSPVSEDIREVCLEFMASNLASVSHTPQFKDLPQALMIEMVQLCTARMAIK